MVDQATLLQSMLLCSLLGIAAGGLFIGAWAYYAGKEAGKRELTRELRRQMLTD